MLFGIVEHVQTI
jgi:D-arabinose 1-dehydrogenase-like Zn-dependent alcohol dehydrogenase